MFEEVKIQIMLNVCKAYQELTGRELRAAYDVLYDESLTINIVESVVSNEVLITLTEDIFRASHSMSLPWFELQNNSIRTLETVILAFENIKEEKLSELVQGVKKILYMRFEKDPDKFEFNPTHVLKYGDVEIDFRVEESISSVLVIDDTGEVLNMKLSTATVTPDVIIQSVLPIIEMYISIY